MARICTAALELFCALGVEAVTIDEIVARAGVAKGSFYRYFAGKEELLDSIFSPPADLVRQAVQRAQGAMHEVDDPSELTSIYGTLATDIAVVLAPNLEVLKLYLQENRGPNVGARMPIVALARDLEESAFALTRVARSHGLLRNNYNERLGTLASIGALERLLRAFLDGDPIGTAPQIATGLIDVILDGVRARGV